MRNSIRIFSKLSFVVVVATMFAFVTSCSNDDDDSTNEITLTGQNKTYALGAVSNAAISGTVKFAERSDHSTLVTIDLDGTASGSTHPAHIHANSAAETGDIIIDLNSVDGTTGKSETVVKTKKDGTAITYDQLLQLDGYVNVHESSTDLTTLIAQGDIGGNETTTTYTSYTLSSVGDSEITGVAKFTKRVNGTTLVTVILDGTTPSALYPIYIYENNIATAGSITIDLNKVDGGVSNTNVTQLNSGTAITYDQLIDYNGHIAVSAGTDALTTLVSQTNIGSNTGAN